MEDWATVVVASNTWAETLLTRFAILINDAAGSPISNPEGELFKRGLAKFTSYYLGQRFLMGNWDHTDESTEFGKWHRDCYIMRNRVVHAGHFPTMPEAKAAYLTTNRLAWHVTRKAVKIKDEKLGEFLKPLRKMVVPEKQ